MPKRDDIKSVLVIGSGPIVIGQACEFDYSGTQACRVLREEGVRVILVNSNPATIMTDPDFADATYIEPITPEVIETIIAKERPDAVLADPGRPDRAQRGDRRCTSTASSRSTTSSSSAPTSRRSSKGEDRQIFKELVVERCGAESRASRIRHTMDECLAAADDLGYPLVVRPSFTMGGLGSGFAYDEDDLRRIAGAGPARLARPPRCCSRSRSSGWKEYELELMRDTRRQRRGRLLDRERRPGGRAHRRLDHRRAGADPHRPRVPAAARHRHRHHPRGRASTPAAATSSSRSTPPTAGSSSSR